MGKNFIGAYLTSSEEGGFEVQIILEDSSELVLILNYNLMVTRVKAVISNQPDLFDKVVDLVDGKIPLSMLLNKLNLPSNPNIPSFLS